MKSWKYSTRCIHADKMFTKDQFGSHATPIYQTSSFEFETIEDGRRLFAATGIDVPSP